MSKICQKCKKARATVHLTEIDADSRKPHELHLCDGCARDEGMAAKQQPVLTFTTSMIGAAEKDAGGKAGAARKLTCPICGMTFQEFRLKGRLGCANCYEAFEDALAPLLEKVHGASQYVGPRPAGRAGDTQHLASMRQELIDLRRRLNRLIKEEDYEAAAKVRDRIHEVEKGLDDGNGGPGAPGDPGREEPPSGKVGGGGREKKK